MGRLSGANLGLESLTRCLWLTGSVVLLVVGLLCIPPSSSQTSTSSEGQPPPQDVPSAKRPPAMPFAATEQVLELSLEDALRLALQNNLDIERERFSPQIQRTEVEKARASFDPTIGVEATISQTKSLPESQFLQFDPNTGTVTGVSIIRPFLKRGEVTPSFRQKVISGGNYEIRFVNTRENIAPASFGTRQAVADPRYESSIELTFTQPLLKDFGIAVNETIIRQAEQTTAIAEQQVLQTVLDTVFAVQQSYWELVFRRQDLGAKRESQKLAEDFLAENTVRVELGTLAPIELVQGETRVKTRQGEVIVAEAELQEAEDGLKEVLNLPETMGTWRIRIRPTDSPPFVPISTVSVEEKVVFALQNRPDFAQSQLDIVSREIARDFARNQQLPRLDVVGQSSVSAFGDGFDASLSNVREVEGYEWLIGLQFEYPLGNRLARNEFRKRNLELKRALVDQRKLKRTIARQIRRAVRDLETSIKRVEVTRAATVLARTQLEAEQEKFRLGLSTSFNVLEFQEDLTIARSGETRAMSDYNVALARLDQLTGTLRYGDITTGNTKSK